MSNDSSLRFRGSHYGVLPLPLTQGKTMKYERLASGRVMAIRDSLSRNLNMEDMKDIRKAFEAGAAWAMANAEVDDVTGLDHGRMPMVGWPWPEAEAALALDRAANRYADSLASKRN